jgi:O-antigen ligase
MPADRVARLTDLERMLLADAALLGNRDDVGTALLVPTILCWTLALQRNVERRWLHAIVAVALTASVLATRTITSIAALGVGMVTLAFVRSWRRALPALAALAIMATIFVFAYPPMHNRVSNAVDHIREGEYNDLTSGRLFAFRAATKMFADHPVTGVGPGRFGREFFHYALVANDQGPGVAFNEAHNDQLQLLAETGLIGYAIFIAAAVVLVRNSRGPRRDPRETFSRDASLPLAASIFVSTFAQFPLQLAVTIVTYATALGVLRGWTERA